MGTTSQIQAMNIRDDMASSEESSPLLSPSADGPRSEPQNPLLRSLDEQYGSEVWKNDSKSSWYMFILTIENLGQQLGWVVEMTYGSPFLLSIGINKALLAFVWIAGPLAGVVVQPFVGLKSDRSRSKYGKRRPYIVGGALFTILCLMALAWSREIISMFMSIFGVKQDSYAAGLALSLFAVFFIYGLDFAINVLQASQRSFAVDSTPHHQQDSVNAWIARMMGIGSIAGTLLGGINLQKYFSFFGDTQFKVLCALASLAIAFTAFISVTSIPERDARNDSEVSASDDSLISIFRGLWRAIFRLPPQIQSVCEVQILAWIGWFPVLFYSTTFIAEIYADPLFEQNPNLSAEEINKIWDEGTRRGSIAMLVFAVVSFASSIILPILLPPIPKYGDLVSSTPASLNHRGTAFSQLHHPTSKWGKTLEDFQQNWTQLSQKIQIPFLTLRKIWICSHVTFAVLMWTTFLARSVTLATIVIGLVGIPWAVATWVPFALVSTEISKREAIRRGIIPAPPTRDGALLAANEDDTVDSAGVVMGIHNVAISAPQVLATIIGSLLFQLLEKPRGVPGDTSVAWFLRVGGIFSFAAAYWSWKIIKEEGQDDR